MNPTRDELLEKERLLRDADLRAVLGTEAGRRFVWRLIDGSGVFSQSYAGEALANAFNEGRRAVGIALMQESQTVSSRLYVEMLAEELARLERLKTAPEPKED